MKEYRKLDDSITMRLNRTVAQYRDMDRVGSAGKGTVEDQACLQVWRELVGPCMHPSRNYGPLLTPHARHLSQLIGGVVHVSLTIV